MKTIYKILSLFILSSFLSGCINDELSDTTYIVELTAIMEDSEKTRTTLSGLDNGAYYPIWSEDDKVAVYVDDESEPAEFNITSGAGTTCAIFSGKRYGNNYLALYPYGIAGRMEDRAIQMNMPGTQQYSDASFGNGSNPMIAHWSGKNLEFRNLCAIMKISITGKAAIKSITLTTKDTSTFLSGNAKAYLTNESTPVLVMDENGSNSVTLMCKGKELAGDIPTDFHIVIPAQTYLGGFTIEIDAYTETFVKDISSNLEFKRSQIRNVKGVTLQAQVPEIIYDAIPDNEIWYISNNNSAIPLCQGVQFGADIISNTYENGIGKIKFNKEVSIIDSKGGEMFAGDALLKIVLPGKITSIEGNPFSLSRNLTEFIGNFASEDGKSLVIDGTLCSFAPFGISEYTIPEGVGTIGPMAFYRNVSLRKIVIPESVTSIGEKAFYCNMEDDTKLEEIYLPLSLKDIGIHAFAGCRNIKGFYGNNSFIYSNGHCIVIENYNGLNKKVLVSFASGSGISEYTIPEGVEAIDSYAFNNATSLKTLIFPDSCTDICDGAFKGASNIESITGRYVLEDRRSMVIDSTLVLFASGGTQKYTTPESVKKLSKGVLSFKDNIKEYILSDNIEYVPENECIFEGCSGLESITISARLKNLGSTPFGNSSNLTPSLKTVYCRAITPPQLTYSGTFDDPVYKFNGLTIYIPKGVLNQYMSAMNWMPYIDYVSEFIYTNLPDSEFHFSTDYSHDGVAATLQKASEGNGIDIVLMGDGYSDRMINDGSYREDMEFVYNNLFTKEPYKSFKKLFNVNYVNVVSATEGFDYGSTSLSCGFGNGTLIYGDNEKCFEYAKNVIAENQLDKTLIIVVLNTNRYAGTCYMYAPEKETGDHAPGAAIAYFPKGENQQIFAQLLHHEACGHGFAKLADEYSYELMGEIPPEEVKQDKELQSSIGWLKNVDFTNDSSTVRWSKFLSDTLYRHEGLGTYEGGLTYWKGVWRPTDNSIMNDNTGEFNAPSREAIYYRIHKLAYGLDWEYNYSNFIEYDAVNRMNEAYSLQTKNVLPLKPLEPLHPPVIIRNWNK